MREAVSIEQNKIVAERFFEEVFNNKKVEVVDELVSGDVVDHNKIIFAQPEGPFKPWRYTPDLLDVLS